MLAPANHGSPLAAIGKKRIGRIKAWFAGVEPGQRILDWLSLGSKDQFELSKSFIDYKSVRSGFFPFVLTGQSTDKKFYDFLNSYLVEPGSDGVVRVTCANMNYSMIKLVETKKVEKVKHGFEDISVHFLKNVGGIKRPQSVALGVIPGASHSGSSKGIMRSVVSSKSSKIQVSEILKCLKVNSAKAYNTRSKELDQLTTTTQKNKHRYLMLVFSIKDHQGDPVNDYDLFLLGGDEYSPEKLSKGFFVDRQQNAANPNRLVYYVDYDVIIKNKLMGFRIIARPSEGFTFYHWVEYRSDGVELNSLLKPNETFYIEVELNRCVDKSVFRFDKADDYKLKEEGFIFKKETRHSFKDEKPADKEIIN